MTKTTKVIICCTLLLGVIYVCLFSPARHGYGYMGYGGYRRGPSFWRFWESEPETYYERSNRSGSVSGPKRLGRGPGSGK